LRGFGIREEPKPFLNSEKLFLIMITAYRFNFSRLPRQIKAEGEFDQERALIYKQILALVGNFQMRYFQIHRHPRSSKSNWFPLNTLLSKFKAVYGLAIAEREEICTILIARILGGVIRSQVG
jgi:hypothetical protein